MSVIILVTIIVILNFHTVSSAGCELASEKSAQCLIFACGCTKRKMWIKPLFLVQLFPNNGFLIFVMFIG